MIYQKQINMAVYREGFELLKNLQKASRQIFKDACDYGVLVTKDDINWNYAKQLADWYGDKATRKVVKYETGLTLDIIVTLIDEWAVSDEIKTVKQATENYKLSFVKTTSVKNHYGFITVERI